MAVSKDQKPRPPAKLWPAQPAFARFEPHRQRATLIEAFRLAGLEVRRRGEDIGQPKHHRQPPRHRPIDPVLSAVCASDDLRRVAGAVRIDGGGGDTAVWAEIIHGAAGPMLSLYTHLGEDLARDLGAAAAHTLRAAGWRTKGAGPTIGKPPGKASGVWVANLSLAALSSKPLDQSKLAR